MRIIGGSAKGRTLLGPRSDDVIRPTADRVRQTLFDVLGQRCDGLSVLDLFAGTGALAFEALSRGAASAVLVDSGKEAQALCKKNGEALGFQFELLAMPVARALELLSKRGASFDLVFIDPPYALEAGQQVLEQLTLLVRPEGRVVLEHAKREEVPQRVGELTQVDQRSFGETRATLYQRG